MAIRNSSLRFVDRSFRIAYLGEENINHIRPLPNSGLVIFILVPHSFAENQTFHVLAGEWKVIRIKIVLRHLGKELDEVLSLLVTRAVETSADSI